MATVSLPEQKISTPTTGVTQIQEVAETIREDSLALAIRRSGSLQRNLPLETLFLRHDFVENFKYGLAVGVANSLAANDARVQAVYTYDPSANPDADLGDYLPLDGTIHLLIRVSKPSPALNTFIESLDRALTQYTKDLPSALYIKRSSVINALLISDEDVAKKTGYANLLGSIFAPPLKIFQAG